MVKAALLQQKWSDANEICWAVGSLLREASPSIFVCQNDPAATRAQRASELVLLIYFCLLSTDLKESFLFVFRMMVVHADENHHGR